MRFCSLAVIGVAMMITAIAESSLVFEEGRLQQHQYDAGVCNCSRIYSGIFAGVPPLEITSYIQFDSYIRREEQCLRQCAAANRVFVNIDSDGPAPHYLLTVTGLCTYRENRDDHSMFRRCEGMEQDIYGRIYVDRRPFKIDRPIAAGARESSWEIRQIGSGRSCSGFSGRPLTVVETNKHIRYEDVVDVRRGFHREGSDVRLVLFAMEKEKAPSWSDYSESFPYTPAINVWFKNNTKETIKEE